MDGQPPPEGGEYNGEGAPEGAPVPESLIPPEIKEDMENLWSVFELQNTNAVPISELRIIMRALDFDLDPEQLEITR